MVGRGGLLLVFMEKRGVSGRLSCSLLQYNQCSLSLLKFVNECDIVRCGGLEGCRHLFYSFYITQPHMREPKRHDKCLMYELKVQRAKLASGECMNEACNTHLA